MINEATTPITPIDSGSITGYLPALQGATQSYGQQLAAAPGDTAVVYNPFTRSFDKNPNFLSPIEAQSLQNERLAYMAQTDPITAAHLAQIHNTGTNSTQVPGSELGNYRMSDGSQPTMGATYGQLVGGGAANVPQGTNAAATSLESEAALVQQAHTAYLQANPNQGSGAIHALLAKINVGPGATYEKLRSALGAQGIGLPELGSDPSSVNSLFTSKLSQLAQQYTSMLGQRNQQYQQQAAPSVQLAPPQSSPPMNFSGMGNFSSAPSSDAYNQTGFNPVNPGQSGANSFYASQSGGQ